MKAKRFSHVFHDDGSVQQTSRTLGSRSLAQHRRSTAYLASKKRIEVWYFQACPNHINQKEQNNYSISMDNDHQGTHIKKDKVS
jgi:hypothetical protein